MKYEKTVRIDAPAERVWAVLSDVARWPEWTPTMSEVRPAGRSLSVGDVVTVKQPGRRATDLTVQVIEVGRRFQWGRDSGGVRQTADHVVTPTPDGGSSVLLTFAMAGPVGSAMGVLGAGKIRQMVDTEAASLKERTEASTG